MRKIKQLLFVALFLFGSFNAFSKTDRKITESVECYGDTKNAKFVAKNVLGAFSGLGITSVLIKGKIMDVNVSNKFYTMLIEKNFDENLLFYELHSYIILYVKNEFKTPGYEGITNIYYDFKKILDIEMKNNKLIINRFCE